MNDVIREVPLSELTLRRYESPTHMEGRMLVRKFCLSVGLLQPGDSRDIIVEILYVLLLAKKNNRMMNSDEVREEVIAMRKSQNQRLAGIAASNVRRQLKRLRDLYLIEKIRNQYRMTEGAKISDTFSQKVEIFLLQNTLTRVREYCTRMDECFG